VPWIVAPSLAVDNNPVFGLGQRRREEGKGREFADHSPNYSTLLRLGHRFLGVALLALKSVYARIDALGVRVM
jgi:hypothetical protein